MKKLLFVLFALQFCIQSYSQVNFEKAYFIDNNGVRTECFIKNKDLYNSPISFKYKLNEEESTVSVGELKNIKEFGIDNIIKYERHTLKVDMSSTDLNKLSEKSEPEWKERTLFLRVLIDGAATFYEYIEDNSKKYFYKLNNSPVEQLIYKKYHTPAYYDGSNVVNEGGLSVNKEFQRQLWSNLSCDNATMEKVMKLEYTNKDLSNYFMEYNNCKNYTFIDLNKKENKDSFNFKLKSGMMTASLQIPYGSIYNGYVDFGSKPSLCLGAEMEYIMPFNRNKWAINLETSYQNYQKEISTKTASFWGSEDVIVNKWEVNYKYFDLGLGLRHYMFLNDKSSVFLNLEFVFGFPIQSNIKVDNNLYRDIFTRMGNSYGFGYSYNKKYSLEFKLSSNHLDKYYAYSQYDTFSVILGYTIFNNAKRK